MKLFLNLLNSILFSLAGILWLVNGIRDESIFDFFLALVWLSGGIIWLVRYFKEKNESEKEN